MLYQTSRHLWLHRHDDQIVVRNVCTRRRALLLDSELPHLELYTEPQPHDGSALTQRLLDADILVALEGPAADNGPAAEVMFAVEKYLAEHKGLSRSRLRQQLPDPLERLQACREIVLPLLAKVSAGARILTRRHVSEDFASALDHVTTFLRDDAVDPGPYDFDAGFLSQTVGRPMPRLDYEQQPCLPHTTAERVRRAEAMLPADGRCLILGDDDLLGLYWGQRMSQPADVFELDSDLLTFLKPRLAPQVSLHQRDLTAGLPEEFHGRYDAIFTDPMYEATGMRLFIECCAQGLSQRPEARVYFTTRPDLIELGDGLFEQFAKNGLEVAAHHRNFSRYPFADFVRKTIFKDFAAWKAPMQLVDGLLKAPYLYADLFELQARRSLFSSSLSKR